MSAFVALLRAVNVGGTGKLAMSDLTELCVAEGFEGVQTYIQSGNVVFRTSLSEAQVARRLGRALAQKMGQPVGVLIRTAAELRAILKNNPFRRADPSRVVVMFLSDVPGRDVLEGLVIPGREQVQIRGREAYVHYPDGMGRSKLKLPFAKTATGRNLNTVEKLARLAEGTETRAARASAPRLPLKTSRAR
jgi:uncharacterized protein (DUF1697 family)